MWSCLESQCKQKGVGNKTSPKLSQNGKKTNENFPFHLKTVKSIAIERYHIGGEFVHSSSAKNCTQPIHVSPRAPWTADVLTNSTFCVIQNSLFVPCLQKSATCTCHIAYITTLCSCKLNSHSGPTTWLSPPTR